MAKETYLGSATVKDTLLTTLQNDLDELFGYASEIVDARDGKATLLAQVDALQASIAALVAASGVKVSSNDTIVGNLVAKLLAGDGITLTEGNDGGNETYTVKANVSTTDNKTTSTVLTGADMLQGKVFTNSGAAGEITLTLPAGATSYRAGFLVADAQYIKVQADGTETFRYGDKEGAAGGYVRENTVGRYFEIRWDGSGWAMTAANGTVKADE